MHPSFLGHGSIPLSHVLTLLGWSDSDGKRKLMGWLIELRSLERAQKYEYNSAVLHGLDTPSRVGFSVTEALHIVEDWDSRRCT
jgi:hypothetical protein